MRFYRGFICFPHPEFWLECALFVPYRPKKCFTLRPDAHIFNGKQAKKEDVPPSSQVLLSGCQHSPESALYFLHRQPIPGYKPAFLKFNCNVCGARKQCINLFGAVCSLKRIIPVFISIIHCFMLSHGWHFL